MGWCGNQGCSSRPTPWKEWAASPRGKQSLFCSAEIDFLGKTLFEYTSATPRCICFPPRATSAQVHLVQVQVHRSVAELGLGVLERSRWWAPRATSAQVPLVQVQVHLGYNSVYLDLDSGYLSGVGQVHLPPLWYLYYNQKQEPKNSDCETSWLV